jgi:hypothetical protein
MTHLNNARPRGSDGSRFDASGRKSATWCFVAMASISCITIKRQIRTSNYLCKFRFSHKLIRQDDHNVSHHIVDEIKMSCAQDPKLIKLQLILNYLLTIATVCHKEIGWCKCFKRMNPMLSQSICPSFFTQRASSVPSGFLERANIFDDWIISADGVELIACALTLLI